MNFKLNAGLFLVWAPFALITGSVISLWFPQCVLEVQVSYNTFLFILQFIGSIFIYWLKKNPMRTYSKVKYL